MILINLIRGYSASNTMVARTGGDWPVFELRKAKKLLRKSLHILRREAATTDEDRAGVLPPSSDQCPITGKVLGKLKTLSCSESGTSSTPSADTSAPLRQSSDFTSLEARALIFELLELMHAGAGLSERICDYLAKAEDKERDVWLRDDIRLAFLTVLYAGRGYDIPDVWAYYYYLGGHPKKIIPILVERAAKHAAMEAPPKKAAASERKAAQGKKAA